MILFQLFWSHIINNNHLEYQTIFSVAGMLDKYVKILDEKFKTQTLKEVYAGVNGRSVDDPELQAFFKVKCWI